MTDKCKHANTTTNEYAGTTYCDDCHRLVGMRIEE